MLQKTAEKPVQTNPVKEEATVIDKEVSGKITDVRGTGLPGVSVVLKGSQQGTISNGEGAFSINVPDENAVLVFSFVGVCRFC